MQTSNKRKRVSLIVLVAVFFTLGLFLCKWLFTPTSLSELVNYRLNKMEANGENVDMVFVGGSRTYRSFDPDVFDEELGIKNTINNGSPAQRTTFSYYLLKDTLERFNPKYVVIGSTYNGMIYEQDTRDMLYSLDRLSLDNKLECVYDHYGINTGIQVLMGRENYINNLYPSKVEKNVREKYLFKRGKTVKDTAIVKTNGYRGEYTAISAGSVSYDYYSEPGCFDINEINSRQIEYYDKMIKLCKKEGVKVILVSGPCTLMNVYRTKNYQAAVDYYTSYAKKNGISYYNLNYLKNREEIFPDTCFIDKLHLNYEGGKRSSKIFANIIKDEMAGKDTSHYFYKDLDELKKSVKRIPTCACAISRSADKILVKATSFHNDEITPKYRLLVKVDTDEYKPITKWSTKDKWVFTVDKLKNYKEIKLEAKAGIKGEDIAFALVRTKEVLKDVE